MKMKHQILVWELLMRLYLISIGPKNRTRVIRTIYRDTIEIK